MTTHETELELQKATGVKPKGKDRLKYLTALHAAAIALPEGDEGWDALSEAAQTWVNDATKAFDAGNAPSDFEQPETNKEETVTTKTAKPKTEKKVAVTKPAKEKTVAPAKVAKVAKVAKAAKKTNGALLQGVVWNVKDIILSALKEKAPMPAPADIQKEMKKRGLKSVSTASVTSFRSDFSHSLRFLNENGYKVPDPR